MRGGKGRLGIERCSSRLVGAVVVIDDWVCIGLITLIQDSMSYPTIHVVRRASRVGVSLNKVEVD